MFSQTLFAQLNYAQKIVLKNNNPYWAYSKPENAKPKSESVLSLYKMEYKLAANFYTTQTGFFCNQERMFEKKTKIPFKFRLGSINYTEQLEGY